VSLLLSISITSRFWNSRTKADFQPIQLDYSDLYNTMSFFTGPPEASRSGEGNDHLARAIAEQARKFGEEHWRWEDMQGYMFRLLLE
jgi:hypothetical protein